MDLIKREDAIWAMRTLLSEHMADTAEIRLNELPSAEPEIIRCKDCKHNSADANCGNADCEIYYGMCDQFGYCHRGEKR